MFTLRGWSSFRASSQSHRKLRPASPALEGSGTVGEAALPRSIRARSVEAGTTVALRRRARPRRRTWPWAMGAALLVVTAVALYQEARTSRLQAWWLASFDEGFRFTLEAGANRRAVFAAAGPYDLRLGYARLPDFLARLDGSGYGIDAQARLSSRLQHIAALGLFLPYREKAQAGLEVLDPDRRALYGVRHPGAIYDRFEEIPPAVVDAVLFVEDRQLLDDQRPFLNPAVNWTRLGRAVFVDTLGRFGRDARVIGASTLATQLEKFRHSPEGRTSSAPEKLRQMASASLRAYRGGAYTLAARQQIVADYLNAVPLAATPEHGEVHGLDDGLRAWYGADLADTTRALADDSAPVSAARAQAYKRVLSLILAARRPSYYLAENPAALEDFTNSYLRAMADAGAIDTDLRDAALREPLTFRPAPTPPIDFASRKGANLVRTRLAGLLGVPALYDLDRLDLSVESTLSGPVQDAVTRTLRSLRDPAAVQALGLNGYHLLDDRGDPSRVIYSFTLYERGPDGNRVRVQTDSFDQPLDINAGARLDLGSSAKLRTLITYLEVVAALHGALSPLAPGELRAIETHPRDHLTAWAIEYLARAPDRALAPMLEAAMERRYSASPGEPFVTGGGLQIFHNFEREDDAKVMSVREGFRHSVNLVFIRLMRDVVNYYLYRAPESMGRMIEDPADPRREAYLVRFADREGSEFIRQFYRKYQGKSPDEALELVLGGVRATPARLATIFRSANPDASPDALKALLAARLPEPSLSDDAVDALYRKYAPDAFSRMDRGYIARVHPLELWVLDYLRRRPTATLAETLRASATERQEVYRWLFKTSRRNAQDKRIASLLELEAFLEIHRGWERLGYPFASITPSLASAVGASGDRPAALAELMGIVVNSGVRYPTVLVERLDFGVDTPYDTRLSYRGAAGQQVLAPEIAAAVRPVLGEVVNQGTARSLAEMLKRTGDRHVVGGKTGTGDHRYEVYAPGHRLVESRVVNRAATFVFEIDGRFFGTITAYVPGPEAARYQFTSALPVRLLGVLMPSLAPVLDHSPAPPPRPSPIAAPAR